MASARRAVVFGVLVWLFPFLVSVLTFPLRSSWRALFESIMPLSVCLVVVLLALRYFRGVERGFVREGALLGLLWLAICVLIDLPLMLTEPIAMTVREYAADIGLTYVMVPIITVGFGLATSRGVPQTSPQESSSLLVS